jgi:protease-4
MAYPPRRSAWPWVVLVLGILVVGVVAVSLFFGAVAKMLNLNADGDDADFGADSIAVIDISGVITDADTEKIGKQLQKYGDSSDIKAIMLHIDSPGGGAAASQEIYHEVMKVREEKHKKVVASVESVGASGAYYIASACDRIYANPASVVGSIGVIMEWTNYGDLMRWAKLKNVAITHGSLKDAGDPTRDMTPVEAAYFQSLVDNMYGQFVHDVAVGRHTSDEKITPLATGQVWTGEQAQPLGLIDEQGGFEMALTETARSVGIKGEPNVVRPEKEKRGLLGLLNDDADGIFANPSQMLNRSPGFYFLWK